MNRRMSLYEAVRADFAFGPIVCSHDSLAAVHSRYKWRQCRSTAGWVRKQKEALEIQGAMHEFLCEGLYSGVKPQQPDALRWKS